MKTMKTTCKNCGRDFPIFVDRTGLRTERKYCTPKCRYEYSKKRKVGLKQNKTKQKTEKFSKILELAKKIDKTKL